MSGISVTKDIRKQLLENPNIKKELDNKIFPIVADDGTTFPFVLIKKNGVSVNYSKCGIANDVVTVTIEVVDPNYSKAIQIAEEIRKTLERKKFENVANCILANVTEEYISDTYIVTATYTVTTQENN
ncbi:MAG: DUF3168 domain-containing protein [Muribaculaceae bacterium]|nr:DUF3168 domain-containing protein [Muribaculaceae bacterium]